MKQNKKREAAVERNETRAEISGEEQLSGFHCVRKLFLHLSVVAFFIGSGLE